MGGAGIGSVGWSLSRKISGVGSVGWSLSRKAGGWSLSTRDEHISILKFFCFTQ